MELGKNGKLRDYLHNSKIDEHNENSMEKGICYFCVIQLKHLEIMKLILRRILPPHSNTYT